MRDDERRICDIILREGEIVRDVNYLIGDDLYRQYSIKIDNEVYEMCKCNGDWVYIHRNI